jgi:hypothetical protein
MSTRGVCPTGGLGGKRRRFRGFSAKRPSPSSPSILNREGKEAARGQPAGGDCRRAGPRRRSGCRVKRRGRQGGSILLPTLGCDGVQRRILGRWRTRGGGAWGSGARVLRKERGLTVAVQGEARSAVGSFYSRGEGGNPAGALHADHVRPAMVDEAVWEGSRRGLGRRNLRPKWWWRCWTRPVVQGWAGCGSGKRRRGAGGGGAVWRRRRLGAGALMAVAVASGSDASRRRPV